MPSIGTSKKEIKTEATASAEAKVIQEKDDIIDRLTKQIESLAKAVESITSEKQNEIETLKNQINNTISVAELPTEEIEEYEEPQANKQIRLVSMCYGTLNLSSEPGGRGRVLEFKKYGETKVVLYSALIDIVNSNRSFAEKGLFYILDKNAVYHLGLSDVYENIIPKEILDNIFSYAPSDIINILDSATREQKETLSRNVLDKMYKNEQLDLNKCEAIGKGCKVNLHALLNEMRDFDKSAKK